MAMYEPDSGFSPDAKSARDTVLDSHPPEGRETTRCLSLQPVVTAA